MPSTATRRRSEPKTERTRVPGVYRRGNAYLYTYRVAGRQRWGRRESRRRPSRQAPGRGRRLPWRARGLPHVRFGDYARDWIEHYPGRTSRGFRESTRSMYRQMLNDSVLPYFHGVRRLRLAEIQPRDVKAFIRWMVEQRDPRAGHLLSKSTPRQHVAVLRAMLGDARERGVIRDNPAAGVRVIVPEGDGTGRRPALEKRALTIAELRFLFDAVPERWRLLFEVLAHTGLRIGEAIELRWARDLVLHDRPRIRLRWQWADGRVCEPKTRYGKRDIPLSPGLTRKVFAARPPDSTANWCSPPLRAGASTATTSTATSSARPSAPSASTGSRPTHFATLRIASLRAARAQRRRPRGARQPGVRGLPRSRSDEGWPALRPAPDLTGRRPRRKVASMSPTPTHISSRACGASCRAITAGRHQRAPGRVGRRDRDRWRRRGHLEPMLDAAHRELGAAGVNDTPEVLLADAGYWHCEQMQRVVDRRIQVRIPPG